mmetsp:Transcript_479/g.635  ORF Transcript_479/g.635 Transcript_479/m.635 type:complete len:478 (+) Transcript_479:307-1740(+)|eukprot:CAMPEP_0117755106 /NCGR_PEP_ID=MMETSP0947-20121206/13246_1 /TAXON_ID=44440 /ORGANISM="Chattonella subsalsa, Strain CCMP2191" /LENGTH=477 /DNA_ID=CAMNT_0005574361 /DNA_START=296 /DNA_END=1729 /DNA_ORIENTATION=+
MDEQWQKEVAVLPVEENEGSEMNTETKEFKSVQWEAWRLSQVAMVVFLYMLSVSMLLPAYPALLLRVFDGDDGDAAQWQGMLMGMKSVLELMGAPLIGAYSDRHGRRQILLFSVGVQVLESALVGLFPSLFVLSVVKIIGGLTNGTILTAHTIITDISQHRGYGSAKTAQNFGILGASFGVAFIIGPLTGGYLTKFSLQAPCGISAVIAFVLLMFIFFCFEETLISTPRAKFQWSSLNPIPSLRIFVKTPVLDMLSVPYFLITVAGAVYMSFYMFCDYVFSWTAFEVGSFMAAVGAIVTLNQGVLLRVAVPKYLSQENCVIASNFLHVCGFVLYGLCTQGWMLYAVLATTASACIGDPTMIAVMASFVSPTSQGVFQGALHSLKTLAHAFGAPLFSTVFAYFIGESFVEVAGFTLPGAAFFLAGLLSLGAWAICLYIFKVDPAYARQSAKRQAADDFEDKTALCKKDDNVVNSPGFC